MDETEITKQSYDKIAKDYAERTFSMPIEELRNKFLGYVKNGFILDVGCGPGRDVKYFMERGLNVVGIDYSDGMLKEAKRRVPKGKFKKMDMRNLKFKDETFDAILAISSTHHIPKTEFIIVLGEFKRVLKKGGILLISQAKGNVNTFRDKTSPSIKFTEAPRLLVGYTKKAMINKLKNVGFKILEAYIDKGKYVTVFARRGK